MHPPECFSLEPDSREGAARTSGTRPEARLYDGSTLTLGPCSLLLLDPSLPDRHSGWVAQGEVVVGVEGDAPGEDLFSIGSGDL